MKYTETINIPHYIPKGERPCISEMVRTEKTDKLISHIVESEISDEEKHFLCLAAQRHLAFDYRKIAEYYCHASPELQELMEESALIIVDVDNAIRNGYAKLYDRLEKQRNEQ